MAARVTRLLVVLGLLLGAALPSAAAAVVRPPTSQETTVSPVPDRGADPAYARSYFGARYYRASVGRFTTVDPAVTIEANLVDPQRWNRYAYARNNPLKYVDPQGLDAWDITNSWTGEFVKKYSDFSSSFISQYRDRIDCADLAFVALIMFASENKLPLQLKYFDAGARAWRVLDAASKDFSSRDQYLSAVTRNLGALNVIDNTKPVNIAEARGGDVIMTRYDGSLGHTRVIQSSAFDVASGDYRVVWYQGNLPPVVPERRESLFGAISSVYGNSPRRWSFGTWR